jgi:hypothetical protein
MTNEVAVEQYTVSDKQAASSFEEETKQAQSFCRLLSDLVDEC